jgi:hypothetical protein
MHASFVVECRGEGLPDRALSRTPAFDPGGLHSAERRVRAFAATCPRVDVLGLPQAKAADLPDRFRCRSSGDVGFPLAHCDPEVVGTRLSGPQFVPGVGVDDDGVHRPQPVLEGTAGSDGSTMTGLLDDRLNCCHLFNRRQSPLCFD